MNKKCQIWMAAVLAAITLPASAQRTETKLTDGWEFRRDGLESDKTWKAVTIPHDWAIYGPFSRENDLQHVTVEQNGETEDTGKQDVPADSLSLAKVLINVSLKYPTQQIAAIPSFLTAP